MNELRNLDTVEWNEVDESKAKLELPLTTSKDEDTPRNLGNQEQGKTFVLGLQIFVSAFEEKNRSYDDNAKAISDKAWETAKTAVNGKDSDDFKNVAGNLTALDNLLGVTEKVLNIQREYACPNGEIDEDDYQFFVAIAEAFGAPKEPEDENDLDDYNDKIEATFNGMEDFDDKVETAFDKTAQALQDLTKEGKVKEYFLAYNKTKYNEGEDYIFYQKNY
ncbi:MAG: hypothetical protein LQ350_002597 [Teloschistes chrysophthalmus]|nr:MAG: hypothetical protein LQ350_002597 [Niorma chrysophthalma]